MALTPQEQTYISTLQKQGKSKEELVQALKERRENPDRFKSFATGLTRGVAGLGLLAWQASRLLPWDQSADPESFFNRYKEAYGQVFWDEGIAVQKWLKPESGYATAGEFASALVPMGATTKLTQLGLKWFWVVAPKIASKVAPFVSLASKPSLSNVAKFWAVEGAKDTAIYDTITKGETTPWSVALGGLAGLIGWPALFGASKLLSGIAKQGAKINTSKVGAYVEEWASNVFQTAKKMGQEIVAPYTKEIDEIPWIMSAIKPKQKIKNGIATRTAPQIENEIRLTNDLIRKSWTKPKNLAEYNSAIKEQMRNIGSQIEAKTKQKLKINLTSTAKKLNELANSESVKRLDPQWARELKNMAARMRMKQWFLKVEDAEAMNQFINDELRNVATASETRKKGLQIIVGELRDKLDETLSKLPWEFKELKKTYWALRNVYGDWLSREIVYNRANPEWLISSYSKIEWWSDVVSGLLKILGLDVKWGVADIGKWLTKNKLWQFVKTRNDPNYIINKIFNDSNIPSSIVPDSVPSPASSSGNIKNAVSWVGEYTEKKLKTNADTIGKKEIKANLPKKEAPMKSNETLWEYNKRLQDISAKESAIAKKGKVITIETKSGAKKTYEYDKDPAWYDMAELSVEWGLAKKVETPKVEVKTLEPLIKEARKYKSAESFIKALKTKVWDKDTLKSLTPIFKNKTQKEIGDILRSIFETGKLPVKKKIIPSKPNIQNWINLDDIPF